MTLGNPEHIVHPNMEKLAPFLEQSYSPPERRRVMGIYEGGKALEPMSPRCRVVVNMPVYYLEKNLKHALRQYVNQDARQKGVEFELAVYVNGPTGVDIEKTIPYEQAMAFQRECPGVKIVVLKGTYRKDETNISRIRKDLAMVSLVRAAQVDELDSDNLIQITHDADLQALEPDYLSGIVKEFDKHPRLNGLAGFYDFPWEDFYQDHLFYAVQRFSDMLDIVTVHRDNNIVFKGGASAFRTKGYIESGGIGHRRKMSELRMVYRNMRDADPESVAFSRKLATVRTSARREMMALGNNINLASSHDRFGEPGDLADLYQVPAGELKIPEIANKVTSLDFKDKLERELNQLFVKHVRMKRDEQRVKDFFRFVSVYAGVKIDFIESRLVILDYSVLKENILKKMRII